MLGFVQRGLISDPSIIHCCMKKTKNKMTANMGATNSFLLYLICKFLLKKKIILKTNRKVYTDVQATDKEYFKIGLLLNELCNFMANCQLSRYDCFQFFLYFIFIA